MTVGQSDSTQIVGIAMVHNEDLFIEAALKNVLGFCDRIIVGLHRCTDNTEDIVRGIAATDPRIEVHTIENPAESQDLISPYIGSPTWIFGVDGDEIYDASGLTRLRVRILSGEFDDYWQVLGNVLNVDGLDRDECRAQGYLAPPCRSMTKLYNFRAIASWTGDCAERLHGGEIDFQAGFSRNLRYKIYEMVSWEESDFRCLHVCFLPRSSRQTANVRMNWMEKKQTGIFGHSGKGLRNLFMKNKSGYKHEKYKRGERVSKDIRPFDL